MRSTALEVKLVDSVDRIGQNAVINIHVPYVKASARQVLFRWYPEGLDAFSRPCPAGHQVYQQTRRELQVHLDDPSLPADSFIEQTHE